MGAAAAGRAVLLEPAQPGAPLWALATGTGVTALAWSARTPNMIGVGFQDGTLALYDVKARQVRAVQTCTHLFD